MNRLALLFLLPLQAVAAPVSDTSCADTWERFFELDAGAVAACKASEPTESVVQDWVDLDQTFDAEASAGEAACESIDVIEVGGKQGTTCTRFAEALLCRSTINPHRVAIERGEGARVRCPGE